MSDPNILVSNGTCYSAAGEKLDGSFIPCGNDAFGHQTCCGAGDNCLVDNACFGFHGTGYGSYLTYMAGCSDPDYKDSSCPDKEIDQPWVALTLCDDSDGVWAACSQEGNPSTLRPGSYCSCTDASSATVAFSDSTSLTNICSLPQSTGQSIQFFAGFTPTASSSPGTTGTTGTTAASPSSGSTSGTKTATQTETVSTAPSPSVTASANGSSASSPITSTAESGSIISSRTSAQTGSITTTPSSGTAAGTSGTTSPSETASDPSDSDTASGLTSGAKAGIAVGAAVGGLVLLATIVTLFYLRRKRRRPPSGTESGKVDGGTKPPKYDPTTPTIPEAHGKPVSEADGRAARPWGLRSELEGTPVVQNVAGHPGGGGLVGDVRRGRARRSGEMSAVAELPGSESWQ